VLFRSAVGDPADLTLIDPNHRWTVDPTRFVSKGRNTPFEGWSLTGRAVRTLVAGETTWSLDGGVPPSGGIDPAPPTPSSPL